MWTSEHSWIGYRHAILWLTVMMGACGPEPAVDINPSAELVTSEDGKSVRLAVSMLEPPRGTVVVRAASSDPSEGSVSGPLRFDASNWETTQELVVTGQDDSEADGDAPYQVTVTAEREALGLQHRYVEVFSFVNVDDDAARFQGLGDLPGGDVASYATAVSAAGDVVVGWSRTAQGDEAFRWTSGSGITGLGGSESRANNLSPNGEVIVGSVAEASYEGGRAAATWSGGSLQVIAPYAPPGGPILFYPVDATVVLETGDLFGACIQKGAYLDRLICHIAPGDAFSTAGVGDVFAGDAAGHLVGTTYPSHHGGPPIGPRGYQSGLLTQLDYPTNTECVIPHSCAAEARAFSTDPTTIVGTARLPPAGQSTVTSSVLLNVAFVVTEGEGPVRLPDLAGGDEDGGAYAIDATGRVIGGFGANADGRRATLWVERAPRLLTDAIAAKGGKVPDHWILTEVRAMSPDGLTFVGNGTNPAGQPEAFVVVLPSAL